MQEQLFFGRYLLELPVVGDYFGFFLVCEPVAFAVGQCFHRLCIQLLVVDRLYISMVSVTSMQMKRRLPVGSVRILKLLLVAMNVA